jgi:hypothetical protein
MDAFSYISLLFRTWIETLFVIPFKNWEMLWLLVPVWVAWFFAEFYQEKTGTSLGNAITNAVVILWGSIDCIRQTVNLIVNKTITSSLQIFLRFSLVALIFAYGIIIVILGTKANRLVKYIGRVRVVTYIFAMFVPVFYNAIPFSWNHLFAAVLFFPLFYFVIELIDRIVPDPKAIIEDAKHHQEHMQRTQHAQQSQHNVQHQSHIGSQHHLQHPAHNPNNPQHPYQHNQHPNHENQEYSHQGSRR